MYKENYGNIPNRDKINYYLKEDNPNPGKWVKNSYFLGKVAKKIAKEIGLDSDIAYAIGCLYDIGKTELENSGKQILKAFEILRSETFFFPARIALTHAFVIKDINSYYALADITSSEKDFIRDYLFQIEYNDYDKLIQLLDGVIEDEKYLGIEEKARRNIEKYGDNGFYHEKIKKLKELENYFQAKLKYNISDYCK